MAISSSNEDSDTVHTYVLLHLSHRQLLAPSLSLTRLYGLP